MSTQFHSILAHARRDTDARLTMPRRATTRRPLAPKSLALAACLLATMAPGTAGAVGLIEPPVDPRLSSGLGTLSAAPHIVPQGLQPLVGAAGVARRVADEAPDLWQSAGAAAGLADARGSMPPTVLPWQWPAPVPAVPEPAGWGMAGSGLAMLCWLVRQRRRCGAAGRRP